MNRRGFVKKLAMLVLGYACSGSYGFALAGPDKKRRRTDTPRIAIIIDDIGYNRSACQRFLDIGAALTFAVLPRLPDTKKLSAAIQSQGHEVLLHQPMEPLSARYDPGPGALYVGDSAERIRSILKENLAEIPQAIGVNNHMGSGYTARATEMSRTLSVLEDHQMFFVDSLTTGRSKAYGMAVQLGVPAAARNVFLDNIPEPAAIRRQLFHLRKLAKKQGAAIAIGHPHKATARAVAWFAQQAPKEGFSLEYASRLVR